MFRNKPFYSIFSRLSTTAANASKNEQNKGEHISMCAIIHPGHLKLKPLFIQIVANSHSLHGGGEMLNIARPRFCRNKTPFKFATCLYASECQPATASAASPCIERETRMLLTTSKERKRVTASAASPCAWDIKRHRSIVDVVTFTSVAVTCPLIYIIL